MDDLWYAGRLEALDIAVSFAVTTQLVNESVLRHNCDPYAAHLLGRALTSGILAAGPLDPGERLNICWKYEGKVRTVLVDVGADGSARGLISPTNLSDHATEKEAIFGDRVQLSVIRSRSGKVLTSSSVESIFQDVVNDLAYFFSVSDQVESGMAVLIGFTQAVDRPVDLCQGILIQAMPGCDLERFDRIRRSIHDPAARTLLSRKNESDSHFENVLNALLGEDRDPSGLHYTARPRPRFHCTCNREKLGAVVRSLPYGDRMDMVKKKEPVTINCQFCNKKYELSIEECIEAWNDHG